MAIATCAGFSDPLFAQPVDLLRRAEPADLLTSAQRLIQAGRPADALDLLRPLESQKSGDPAFDYVIGLAYLDNGEPTRAIFALERVVATEPHNARARAELARAHLALGEVESARHDFAEAAGENNVPPEARHALDSLTRVLSPPAAPQRTRFQGTASVTFGYDSNVNSATQAEFVSIPAFADLGLARLSDSARATGSAVADADLDLEMVHPLSDSVALAGGLSGERRENFSAGDFDLTSFGGHFGTVIADGDRTVSIALQGQDIRYDRTDLRQAVGLTVQYQIPVTAALTVSPYVQEFHLAYPFDTTRAVWRSAAGFAAAQAVTIGELTPVLFAGLYGGTEAARTGQSQNGHRFLGARLGGEMSFLGSVKMTLAAAYEDRAYGGEDPVFALQRYDRQLDLALGFSVDLGDKWTLHPDFSWTRAKSTLPVSDYARWTAKIGISKALN